IAAATSSLLDSSVKNGSPAQKELLQTVAEESRRMARQVDNLLDMTRLESGTVELNKQWHVLEEIVGSALARLRRDLEKNKVKVDIQEDFTLFEMDGITMGQVV